MELLDRFKNHLMLKCLELQDISLYHGKTGITLALYLYAHQRGDEILKEYAWDLLQSVHKGVNECLPYGLEWGLAGIGTGITLLKKNGLLDCDLNAVLADIDAKIMEHDPRRLDDFSFRNGALGLYSYIHLRLSTECEITSFDHTYLAELQNLLQKFLHGNTQPSLDFSTDLQAPSWDTTDFLDKPLGLDGGVAYHLFSNYNQSNGI